MASVYKFYGAGASEELDCVPANGGGAWLSRALIESRMSAGTPVLRLTCPEGYELKPDDVRWSETQEWLDTHLKPLLEALPLTHVLSWVATLAAAVTCRWTIPCCRRRTWFAACRL